MIGLSRISALFVLFVPVPVAAVAPPPVGLMPYIHNAGLDPGDYHWLRGEFDGASPVDVAVYHAIDTWRQGCRESDMAETRAELAKLGVEAGASLNSIPYRSLVCGQVATEPEPLNLHDWPTFEHDVDVVRPIAQGFLAAVGMSENVAIVDNPDLRDRLVLKGIGEQTLRAGQLWVMDPSNSEDPLTGLTPQQLGILQADISIALEARDHANTSWIKGVVAAQGWPTRSRVGENAAKTAWLLVQHADADPAFQLQMLRLIEPLTVSGEIDGQTFAYLYDRVMLKITGKQRFGTQLTCRAKRLVHMPLEDEHVVDAKRREVGMQSLEAYEANATRESGPCQDSVYGH